MRILLDKSDENIRTASELINQHEYYAASVHCSYYACYQVVMDLFEEKYKVENVCQTRNL